MYLLLISETGEKKMIDYSGGDIHTKYGVIKEKVIKPGSLVETHKGVRFLILHPTLSDIVQSIRGGAKPIFEYHTAMFAALLGLERGSNVIEAGTGSAGATLVLANYVYPGKVFTFERDPKFYSVAVRNIELSGLDNIVAINDDVSNIDGYLDKYKVDRVDAVFLDLQEPESLVRKLSNLLRLGGSFGVYTPVFDSVPTVWRLLNTCGFISVRAVALTLQDVIVKKYTRFNQRLFGFPGFFVFGRKFKSVDEC